MQEKSYGEEMREKMSWWRRLKWNILTSNLAWKIEYAIGWVLDREYWVGIEADPPYLETLRTKRRIYEGDPDWPTN